MDKKIIDGKEYDVTLGVMNNQYVRPYNRIGYNNEANEYVDNRNDMSLDVVKEYVEKNPDMQENKYDYVSTIGAMKKTYVRPYNTIGYNNDACEGKRRDDDLER